VVVRCPALEMLVMAPFWDCRRVLVTVAPRFTGRKRAVRTGWPAQPSTCSPSSSRSWMPGRSSRSPMKPWTDTTTSTGRLMIAVLGGLADVERDLIRTRRPG
jgi:hypothetical protein